MHKLTLLALLSPTLALAEPTVTASRTDQTVELEWKHDGSDWRRVTLALPPDHTCNDLSSKDPQQELKVAVCRNGGDDQSPRLDVSVERRLEANHATQHLRATVTITKGKSASIGRLDLADHKDEVLAWLH